MDLGLLQKDAARSMETKVSNLVNWEMGRNEPEIRFLPAILAFLGYDPRPTPQTVGEKLVAFREGKGWTRPRLAALLRVDPSTLARWEQGKKQPWGQYAELVEAALRGSPAAAGNPPVRLAP